MLLLFFSIQQKGQKHAEFSSLNNETTVNSSNSNQAFGKTRTRSLKKQSSTTGSSKKQSSAKAARKLISVYSSPGFSTELMRRTQHQASVGATTRSVYSYDYLPSSHDESKQRGGGHRRRPSKSIPFYNEKQLKNIYRQYR